jgi:hypothetical protein
MLPRARFWPNPELPDRPLGQVQMVGYLLDTDRSRRGQIFRATTTADAPDLVCMKSAAWWAIPARHGRRSVIRHGLHAKVIIMEANNTIKAQEPWNKGKLIGQKAPFKPNEIWAIRVRLQAVKIADVAHLWLLDVNYSRTPSSIDTAS